MTTTRGLRNNFLRFSAAIGAAFLLSIGGARAQADLAKDAANRVADAIKATGVKTDTTDFYRFAPYDATVPRPDALLGYPLGTWHSTFRQQEKTLTAIAASRPDRVKSWQYGTSVEGRPLRLFAISSPQNIVRLEEIRTANLALARGTNAASGSAHARLPKSGETKFLPKPPAVPIIWINECIHGSETASFETAMATVYTLAASDAPEIRAVLDNAVVIVNPVFNPDGHERFVVAFNAAATGDPDDAAIENETPWISQGRFNHNRFDMNRDKLAQSQPETRQETAEYLRWMPQVFVDQHGQPENYFFPPNAQATNGNVDRARMDKWTQIFGRANGAAFDKRGWVYVNRETYDLFYPGYLDSFTTLNGAVGMTYETDGGGELITKKRDGTFSTLRDGTMRHFETAIATLGAAATNREALMRDFAAFRGAATKLPGAVLISPERGEDRLNHLADLLARVGISSSRTSAPITVETALYDVPGDKKGAQTFPAGSLVVRFGQAQGHLARALLERDTLVEPDFAARQKQKQGRNAERNANEPNEGYDFYDTTAWSLPLLFDLRAGYVESLSASAKLWAGGVEQFVSIPDPLPDAPAYVVPFASDNALVLAGRMAQDGYRMVVADAAVTVADVVYAPGTLFLRTARNPADAPAKLAAVAASLHVKVLPLVSTFSGVGVTDAGLGSEHLVSVNAARIAVVAGDGVSQTGYGGVAFALRESGIRFTSASIRALGNAETRARFNVVVFPEGNFSRLTKDDRAAWKAWVERGNTLVALGSGTNWLLNKGDGFTTIRVIGGDKDDDATMPTALPGALFRASIRADHFLGVGYAGGNVAVPVAGDSFWRQSTTGANVVTFPKTGANRLAGFVWNDTEKSLANTAYVVDEPVGSGHVILFAQDPCERALYPGLRRMFLSAVLLGR